MLSQKLDTSFDVTLTDQQEVIEIELSPILESVTNVHHSISKLETKPYVPFSLYPYITRDVAVWASNTKTKDDIEKIITEHATDLLFRYDLFDEFSKDNRTSYAYRLVFQSFEKTLTDDEVNLIMDKVYSLLQADSDFEIR
jgi:phenylalanyl-tRNA synthetase beta subunit